jgi:hypothetical protein
LERITRIKTIIKISHVKRWEKNKYKALPLSCLSRDVKKLYWVNFPSLYMAKIMGGDLIRA